jgi:hypothetical protein
MAGLLMRELIARGDLHRCLVVCPGSLAEQWQDELYRRFHLPFEILTNDKLEAARTGNWFLETNLVIARPTSSRAIWPSTRSSKRQIVVGILSCVTKRTKCPLHSLAEK